MPPKIAIDIVLVKISLLIETMIITEGKKKLCVLFPGRLPGSSLGAPLNTRGQAWFLLKGPDLDEVGSRGDAPDPRGGGRRPSKRDGWQSSQGWGGAFSAIQPLDSLLGGIVSTGFLLEGLTSVFPKVRSLGMLSVPCFCPSESHLFFQSPLSCTCTSHLFNNTVSCFPFSP